MRGGLGGPPNLAGADAADAGGCDLGWDAHGHGAAELNAQAVSDTETACLVSVDQDLLMSAAVAHQQTAAAYLRNPCVYDRSCDRFQNDCLQFKMLSTVYV